MRAKKRFGQNFLKNDSMLQKIVQTIPNNNYQIIEIGSGLGDLTQYLLQQYCVTSFEIDKDLEIFLKQKFSKEIESNQLKLIFSDVLLYWNQENLIDFEYNLIANLPYYVATNIILKAIKDDNCKSLIVLVQKEVAQKFGANTGDKSFSALSVIAQSVASVEIMFDVAPHYFEPIPKVNSSVVKIEKFKEKVDNDFSSFEFRDFLKTCFTFPRKTIRKNLIASYSEDSIYYALEQYEIPSTHRPHQIDTKKYQSLFKILKDIKNV